jgi:hypothetical protein
MTKKSKIKKLETRIAVLEARVLNDVKGDWWVKVHGLDLKRKPYVLTVSEPIAISDIAGLNGFYQFSQIDHVEYKHEEFRAIHPQRYPPMDSPYRKHPGAMKFYSLEKLKTARELGLADLDLPIVSVIDGFNDQHTPEFMAQINAPGYMWDDPELGDIFRQIDEGRVKKEQND